MLWKNGRVMGVYSIRGRLLVGTDLVPGAVVVEGDRIARIVREGDDERLPDPVIDAEIVAPGLIDLQVNGGFGSEVGDDAEAIRRLAAHLPATGVTAFLPTAITSPPEFYPRLFEAFDAAHDAAGARLLGLHLEGPLLSPERPGAHRRELLSAADLSLLDDLLERSALRLMTLAPERAGAGNWISRLRSRGVVVSLGHTDASYEAFIRGVDAGATMATHLYNAMAPFQHRAPGATGAALLDDRVTVGLIADGVHSHPASVRLAIRAKGVDRVALVTDMVAAAGMPPGAYELGGRTVLADERSVRLEDGTLAGSILTMDQAIRNLVSWGAATAGEAIYMATAVPAGLLGMQGKGRVEVGVDADLVLFNGNLQVKSTVVGGAMLSPSGAVSPHPLAPKPATHIRGHSVGSGSGQTPERPPYGGRGEGEQSYRPGL